jgi:hypothetical protein
VPLPVSEVSEVSDLHTPSTYPSLLSKRGFKGVRKSLTSLTSPTKSRRRFHAVRQFAFREEYGLIDDGEANEQEWSMMDELEMDVLALEAQLGIPDEAYVLVEGRQQ